MINVSFIFTLKIQNISFWFTNSLFIFYRTWFPFMNNFEDTDTISTKNKRHRILQNCKPVQYVGTPVWRGGSRSIKDFLYCWMDPYM